jgi:hypothetical protein
MKKEEKGEIIKDAVSRVRAKKIGDELGVDWKKFDLGEFQLGLEVELEHKDITKGDMRLTGKIVLAHLKELPDYYTRLEKMGEEGEDEEGEDED